MSDFETIKIGNYNFIPYFDKSKQEWEQIRRSFPTKIGGSDFGVLAGVNPYATRASLFDEKLGMTPASDLSENQSVFWGNGLEEIILDASEYCNTQSGNDRNYLSNFSKGEKVNNHVSFDYTVYHDDFPWLAANIDGMNVEKGLNDQKLHHMISTGILPSINNIVEIKTMSGQVYDKWASKSNVVINGITTPLIHKGLPPGYVYQVMMYMIVYLEMYKGDAYAELFSLVDGQKFFSYRVEWDQAMVDDMMEESYLFHLLLEDGLERKANSKDWKAAKKSLDEIRPEADGSEAFEKHMTENYLKKINIDYEMSGGPITQSLRNQYLKKAAIAKEAEEEKRLVSNKIREILVKNEVSRISLSEGKITYTSNNRLLIK